MNRTVPILLMSLAIGGAYAQGTGGGVTMSTDPAKAAAVESHAQELKARQATEPTSKPAATHKATAKTQTKSKTHAKAHPTTHAMHKSSPPKPAKPAKT